MVEESTIRLLLNTPFTLSKFFWIGFRSQFHCYLDRNPEDAPVYIGTFIVQDNKEHHIVVHCFSYCYIAIHLISGLKLSRLEYEALQICLICLKLTC